MKILLLLLVCTASLVTAGVLNSIRKDDADLTQLGTDLIMRMSREELLRQKFLLDVLRNVQQPLVNTELLELAGALIEDPSKYNEGIDNKMLHVIELGRQNRLLSRQEVFTIADEEHLCQLIGLYRLLARAGSWDIFQRNLVYARQNVNGILLVNALLLAVRDRADTQMLIMPAINEIIPEIYYDEQLIRKVRAINLDALTGDTETVRPGLLDMIGLGRRTRLMNQSGGGGVDGKQQFGILGRTQLWMPWRELHMQMTLSKQQGGTGKIQGINANKLVLPVLTQAGGGVDLLSQDIGLKTFVQGLINELIIREDERGQLKEHDLLDSTVRRGEGIGRVGLERNTGVSMLQRERLQDRWNDESIGQRRLLDVKTQRDVLADEETGRLGGIGEDRLRNVVPISGDMDSLPTVDINDERLLHIGRRRQQAGLAMANGRDRVMIADDDENRSNEELDRTTGIRQLREVSEKARGGLRARGQNMLNIQTGKDTRVPSDRMRQSNIGLDKNMKTGGLEKRTGSSLIDELPTTTIDDERLLHVNRRRLNQLQDQDINEGNTVTRQGITNDLRGEKVIIEDRTRRILEGISGEDKHGILRIMLRPQRSLWDTSSRAMTANDDDRMIDSAEDTGRNIGISNKREHMLGVMLSGQRGSRAGVNRAAGGGDSMMEQGTRGMRGSSINKMNYRRLQQNGMEMDSEEQDLPGRAGMKDSRRIKLENMRGMEDRGAVREDLMTSESRKRGGINLEMWQRSRLSGNLDVDSDIDIGLRRRIPRSLTGIERLNIQREARVGEVLLQNMRQLLARINADRLSLGLNILRESDIKGTGIKNMRDRQILDVIAGLEERINTVLQQQLQRSSAIDRTIDIRDQSEIDEIIGNVLIGDRKNGISILSILSELIQQVEGTEGTQTQALLGLDLTSTWMQELLRRLVQIVDMQRQRLSSYRLVDLQLDGVTINDVVIDRLRTYVDTTDADLVNVLDSRLALNAQQGVQKMVVARQQRLNHKSFQISVDLNSDRNQRVIVRTILLPLEDGDGRQLQLDEQRMNAIVLDATVADLVVGHNLIKRKSKDISWTAPDTTPYTDIYQRVMLAINGDIAGSIAMGRVSEQTCRFPHRLLLPRGRIDGLPMQLLVIVTPVERIDSGLQQNSLLCGIGIGSLNLDRLPLGFPLDRRIDDAEQLLGLSNVMLKDVNIYHEDKPKITNL